MSGERPRAENRYLYITESKTYLIVYNGSIRCLGVCFYVIEYLRYPFGAEPHQKVGTQGLGSCLLHKQLTAFQRDFY